LVWRFAVAGAGAPAPGQSAILHSLLKLRQCRLSLNRQARLPGLSIGMVGKPGIQQKFSLQQWQGT